MRFSIFLSYAQIKNMGIQHKPVLRNFEILDFVVLLGIKNMVFIGSQPFAQMNIVAVAAQTIPVVWLNFYRPFVNFFQYALVRQNHGAKIYIDYRRAIRVGVLWTNTQMRAFMRSFAP